MNLRFALVGEQRRARIAISPLAKPLCEGKRYANGTSYFQFRVVLDRSRSIFLIPNFSETQSGIVSQQGSVGWVEQRLQSRQRVKTRRNPTASTTVSVTCSGWCAASAPAPKNQNLFELLQSPRSLNHFSIQQYPKRL
jgi:hypothetical protein